MTTSSQTTVTLQQVGDSSSTRIESSPDAISSRIGVVVIGRNEGERLKRCLRSLVGRVGRMVYVDSGSADGSVDFAKSLGVEVIDLDMSKPFTMARGRNAGWRYLAEQEDPVEFVQFVDGDCEVVDGWIEKAYEALMARSDVVAVCGRRRERFPEASIYNRLADMEWDGPVGEVKYSGGDVMMRLDAIATVDGFNDRMIAGEEPELCVRLRQRGGKILRIAEEMTLHDAAMTRFSQWWRRAQRAGHAYAEGASLHGQSESRHNVRQIRSTLIWGVAGPLFILMSVLAAAWQIWFSVFALLGATAYFTQFVRIANHRRRHGDSAKDARLYSVLCILGKFPAALGMLQFWMNRARRRQSTLIEYKAATE